LAGSKLKFLRINDKMGLDIPVEGTTMAQLLTTVHYPDSDGQPMADNTKQFRWIVTIKENLEAMFAENPDVFVAGDLLWYPIEGNNVLCRAPDVMVAFGRPKGDRGSYQQWQEGGVAPQVVFEILSPGNRLGEMINKFQFYDRYGVEEYYVYDPDRVDLTGWQRQNGSLQEISAIQGWVSPRLGIRYQFAAELEILLPNGQRFLSFQEVAAEAKLARESASLEQQRADLERQRADLLAAKLIELGIDPNNIS
jgi:Uma2 family endonuclease